MYQIVFLLLAAVSGSFSQILVDGDCPITTGAMATYNYYRIIGKWYQIQRIENDEEKGECSTTFFGGMIVDSMQNREVVKGKEEYNNGTVTLRPQERYRFTVKFQNSQLPKDYYLIGFNFTSALIARCDVQRLPNNTTRTNLFAWKLSRTDTLLRYDDMYINELLADIPPLESAKWKTTSHSRTACEVTDGAGSLASSLVLIVTALLFVVKENF